MCFVPLNYLFPTTYDSPRSILGIFARFDEINQENIRSFDTTFKRGTTLTSLPSFTYIALLKKLTELIKNLFKMSSEVLLKVRERMQKMKDKIEDAENREHDAKEECKEVEATLGQNETDIDSMKKRIQLLTKELDEKNALLEERKMKSGQLEEKYEKENEVVRELENVEIGEDERMHELETDLTETSQKAEQLELQNTELRQKLGQLENEIQKV